MGHYAKHTCPGGCGRQVENRYNACRTCSNVARAGEANPHWKGGISQNNYHYKKLQKTRYPERVNARQRVHRAIKVGKLARTVCQWPGCEVEPHKTQAHHWSYEEGHELDVTFFCRPHHRTAEQVTREQFQFIQVATWKLFAVQKLDEIRRQPGI